MQKVKTFFHIFHNSLLPQANYYHKLIKNRFSFSLKYFTTLIYLVNFVFIIFFLVKLNFMGALMVRNSLLTTVRDFPDELSITVQNGILRSNYNRPYFVWFSTNNQKKLLAVVDENAAVDKIKDYGSPILFTSETIVIKSSDRLQKIPYGARTILVNKDVAIKLSEKLAILFSWGTPVLLLFLVAVAPLIFTGLYLIYFFIISGIVFLLFSLSRRKIRLKKTFQLSLHAGTVPVIINYGLCFFKPQLAGFGPIYLMFFILSFIFVFSAAYEGYLDPITRIHRHHS